MTQQVIEEAPAGRKLLQECSWVQCQLVERKGRSGAIVFRGKFGQVGVATENKRRYSRPVVEREITKLRPDMEARGLYGELDHPTDTRRLLQRSSHIITDLRIEEDGSVVGEAEVITGTPAGDVLAALVKNNCRIGVSSRGFGSTTTTKEGIEEVGEDFNLVTYDVVADPAAAGSYPKAFYESLEAWARSETMDKKDPTPANGAKTEDAALKAAVASKLQEMLPALKTEALKQARAEALADPAVAGAKLALERVKKELRPFVLAEDAEAELAAKDKELEEARKELAAKAQALTEAQAQVEKYAKLAAKAAYTLHLERTLSGNPDAALVKGALGDLARFESKDELDKAISEAVAAARVEREKAETERQAVEAKEKEFSDKVARLEEQNKKLAEGLKAAVSAAKKLAVQVHTERKIQGAPNAAQARQVVEQAQPTSATEVDKILAQVLESETPTVPTTEAARANARRLAGGGGRGPTPRDEEQPRPTRALGEDKDYNGLGIGLGELQELAAQEQ